MQRVAERGFWKKKKEKEREENRSCILPESIHLGWMQVSVGNLNTMFVEMGNNFPGGRSLKRL